MSGKQNPHVHKVKNQLFPDSLSKTTRSHSWAVEHDPNAREQFIFALVCDCDIRGLQYLGARPSGAEDFNIVNSKDAFA